MNRTSRSESWESDTSTLHLVYEEPMFQEPALAIICIESEPIEEPSEPATEPSIKTDFHHDSVRAQGPALPLSSLLRVSVLQELQEP
jgi:hypothetical protein